jgi:hypothetical protein
MGFFRCHIRNINKYFITDYVEKQLTDKKDDLSDRDYSKTLHIFDINDLLDQMDFTLSQIFNFEKSFFSSDISLINKYELKYELDYEFDNIIQSSSKGMILIKEFPIKDTNNTLFAKESLDIIRVLILI